MQSLKTIFLVFVDVLRHFDRSEVSIGLRQAEDETGNEEGTQVSLFAPAIPT
jgi:hypothetical protein